MRSHTGIVEVKHPRDRLRGAWLLMPAAVRIVLRSAKVLARRAQQMLFA